MHAGWLAAWPACPVPTLGQRVLTQCLESGGRTLGPTATPRRACHQSLRPSEAPDRHPSVRCTHQHQVGPAAGSLRVHPEEPGRSQEQMWLHCYVARHCLSHHSTHGQRGRGRALLTSDQLGTSTWLRWVPGQEVAGAATAPAPSKQWEAVRSQFWRPGVQDQGASKAGFC